MLQMEYKTENGHRHVIAYSGLMSYNFGLLREISCETKDEFFQALKF